MSIAEFAIASGLTPRRLEELLRGHASVEQIADVYGISERMVGVLMERWQLARLSGREKISVTLVRNLGEG